MNIILLSTNIDFIDLVKFVMCIMVSKVHMIFYILTKGYIVLGKAHMPNLGRSEIFVANDSNDLKNNILAYLNYNGTLCGYVFLKEKLILVQEKMIINIFLN